MNDKEILELDFEKLNLDENLLRGIYSYGFEKPSEIQHKAIPIIKEGKDIIAQSKSGTGKTGAFSIGCISSVDNTIDESQVLIICPTYELVHQTYEVIDNFINYIENISIMKVIGGSNLRECQMGLEKRPKIIIGTPGRILDMIQRKYLITEKITRLVFDEADEILSYGFKETIHNIVKYIPKTSQISLFSATLPDEVLEMTELFMDNPVKILLEKDNITLEGIKQYYVNVMNDKFKLDTLIDIFSQLNVGQCIVYLNSKYKLDQAYHILKQQDFPIEFINGELKMNERKQIINDFKAGNIRMLLSTDLLSRGLDIQQLSLVINLELPVSKESYIHRIGRSGRYGRKGVAINILNQREFTEMDSLMEYYNTKIDLLPQDLSSIDL